MAIRGWHWGKVVILWAWGGVIAGLLLADFLGTPVRSAPMAKLVEFVSSVGILVALSMVTWTWLSGRESRE